MGLSVLGPARSAHLGPSAPGMWGGLGFLGFRLKSCIYSSLGSPASYINKYKYKQINKYMYVYIHIYIYIRRKPALIVHPPNISNINTATASTSHSTLTELLQRCSDICCRQTLRRLMRGDFGMKLRLATTMGMATGYP